MPITRHEYQIKQLAFSLAREAIREKDRFDAAVIASAMQIFIRVPGLKLEHDCAMEIVHQLDILGIIAVSDADNYRRQSRRVSEAFSALDDVYDPNRGFDHYADLDPHFIAFEEEGRV